MLIIGRKVGQRFLVGDTWVTVLEYAKGGVRLGIDGPRGVTVLREEVYIKQQARVKEDKR